MATVTEAYETLELDEDGYLLRPLEEWNVKVAESIASKEGIGELSAEHWKLIAAIRLYYERHGESPLCRDVLIEAGYSKKDMYRLFPAAGYKTAFKLAGLPKPPEC